MKAKTAHQYALRELDGGLDPAGLSGDSGSRPAFAIGIGISIGMGLGAALGVASGNPALSVTLGTGLGLSIGLAVWGMSPSRRAPESRRPSAPVGGSHGNLSDR